MYYNSYPAIIFAIIIIGVTAQERISDFKNKKIVPPRMNPAIFPDPIFDENAPECIPLREPCGFYSFSLNGGAPLKWVKSWCRCDADHECAYERTDMRMRVYRQVCIPLQ